MTETLTEFLLARIAEREEAIRYATGKFAFPMLLAECEAKRRIIARHSRTPVGHWSGPGNCEGCGFSGGMDMPNVTDREECPELQDLALPYADHPDYREEWKP